jgi:hypothetical protein
LGPLYGAQVGDLMPRHQARATCAARGRDGLAPTTAVERKIGVVAFLLSAERLLLRSPCGNRKGNAPTSSSSGATDGAEAEHPGAPHMRQVLRSWSG